MQLQPLGDQALLAVLPDEASAFAFARTLASSNRPWLQDVVPAYSTVGIFFNAEMVRYETVRAEIETMEVALGLGSSITGILHRIPVCYEHQLDMPRVMDATGLTADDVIRWHSGSLFTVYAIGFVPGFPYMGYLPAELAGVPRLATPRMRVEPGSVGITGRQTGIYPLPRPGGWNIIARTPLTIVDVEGEYFPLKVGDRVQFVRIDEVEFQRLLGERL